MAHQVFSKIRVWNFTVFLADYKGHLSQKLAGPRANLLQLIECDNCMWQLTYVFYKSKPGQKPEWWTLI